MKKFHSKLKKCRFRPVLRLPRILRRKWRSENLLGPSPPNAAPGESREPSRMHRYHMEEAMASTQRIRRTFRQFLGATVMLLATILAASHQAAAAVAEPTVVGPIPVTTTPGVGQIRDYPFFATEPQFNLTLAGYR